MGLWSKVRFPLLVMFLGLAVNYVIYIFKPASVPKLAPIINQEHPRVVVDLPRYENTTVTVYSQGVVKPKREIDVISQVSGRVVRVEKKFTSGSFFSKGQILLYVDSIEYEANLLKAEAHLAKVNHELAVVKGLARQAKNQWKDIGNSDANDLFLRKPQLTQAIAQVKSAKADVEMANHKLEMTRIKVPFDGRISEIFVDLGEYVTIGTKLASVYSTDVAEVLLPLSDHKLALLDIPLGISLEEESMLNVNVRAKVKDKVSQWEGVISRTEAYVDMKSTMYYVAAEINDPFLYRESGRGAGGEPLIPGMHVSATISGNILIDAIVLPRNVMVNGNFIYIVNKRSEIESLQVKVLREEKDKLWVQGNMAPNTPIVYEKHGILLPGSLVSPVFYKESVKESAYLSEVGE